MALVCRAIDSRMNLVVSRRLEIQRYDQFCMAFGAEDFGSLVVQFIDFPQIFLFAVINVWLPCPYPLYADKKAHEQPEAGTANGPVQW